MSRTYRKRVESFRQYYKNWTFNEDGTLSITWKTFYTEEEVKKLKYQYKTKTCKHYTFNLPKFFRNMVNRKRRAYDKQELWKELNLEEYEGLYSSWNCKDNNAWSYW